MCVYINDEVATAEVHMQLVGGTDFLPMRGIPSVGSCVAVIMRVVLMQWPCHLFWIPFCFAWCEIVSISPEYGRETLEVAAETVRQKYPLKWKELLLFSPFLVLSFRPLQGLLWLLRQKATKFAAGILKNVGYNCGDFGVISSPWFGVAFAEILQ